MTGENSLFINLVNVSKSPCSVMGYPDVRFLATGPVLPFQVHRAGNYLEGENAAPARPHEVLPGATVHIFIARYRCDLGVDQTSDSVNVQLVDGADLAAFPLTAGMPTMTSCRSEGAATAGVNPGNVLQVSAFLAG